jgi:P4 family phage/plasmid primase-like protien
MSAPGCFQAVQAIQESDDPGYARNPLDPALLAEEILQTEFARVEGSWRLKRWHGSWWHWREGRYLELSKETLESVVVAHVQGKIDTLNLIATYEHGEKAELRELSPTLVNTVELALKALTQVSDDAEIPSWVGGGTAGPFVVMRNGLLDIEAALRGEAKALRPHSPKWFSTVALEYEYRSDLGLDERKIAQAAPGWVKFVNETFEGDHERVRRLQEISGYVLVAGNDLERFFLFVGGGGTGKSKTLEILQRLVGEANCTNVPLHELGSRFSGYGAAFSLLNVAGELDPAKRTNEAILKSWTGRDRIKVERKNKDPLSVRPLSKLIFSGNGAPKFTDRSRGVWRRLEMMVFEREVPADQIERGIAARLSRELPAIFAWALVGLKRVREQGGFTRSSICEVAFEAHRRESHPEIVFLEDHYVVSKGAFAEKQETYERYRIWADRRGIKDVLLETDFAKAVCRQFPEVDPEYRPRRTQDGKTRGARGRVYLNLKLREGAGSPGARLV